MSTNSEIVDELRLKSTKNFRQELRVAGFIDEEIIKILKVMDNQAIIIVGVKNTTVACEQGIISVHNNSEDYENRR